MVHASPCRVAAVVGLATLLSAASPAQDVLSDEWLLQRIEGVPVGWSHVRTVTKEDGGFRTESTTYLKMVRLGGEVELEMKLATEESAASEVQRLESTMVMSKQPTTFVGIVDGDVMRATSETAGQERSFEMPWDPESVSERVVSETTVALAAGPDGGVKVVKMFDPTMGATMTLTLRKVESTTLEWKGVSIPVAVVESEADVLPGMVSTSWLDAEGHVLKSQQPMMGTQFLTLERSSKAECIAAVSEGAVIPDVFTNSLVGCTPRLPTPRRVEEVLYRVSLRDGAQADLTIMGGDPRQEVVTETDRAMTLRVSKRVPSVARTLPMSDIPDDVSEGLTANGMLQSDDPRIVDAARLAIGDETDAWTAARKLERFVFDRVSEKNMDVAFASALEVLEECTGDCSEHAVLLAALCRAVGIPSRVVMGVVYVGGIFGGHAWTEVWIGEWVALDATTAHGSVGAGHLSMARSFLSDEDGMELFIPLTPMLGGIDVEVLEARRGDQRWSAEDGPAFKRDGSAWSHDILGLAGTLPEGWDVALATEHDIDPVVLKFGKPDGEARAELDVYAVSPTMRVADLMPASRPGSDTSPVTIDGRRGFRVDSGSFDTRRRIRLVFLFEDMCYSFKADVSNEAELAELEALFTSMDFDAGMGVGKPAGS